MNKRAVCPNKCASKQFVTLVHELHEWVVDKDGDFVADAGFIELEHGPSPENFWSCHDCGATAIMEDV